MEESILVYMDESPLTFTEDGRVSVVDAIRMVLDSGSAMDLWERMKAEHPDILAHCEDYAFTNQGKTAVIDKEGWEKVWSLLPEYFLTCLSPNDETRGQEILCQ